MAKKANLKAKARRFGQLLLGGDKKMMANFTEAATQKSDYAKKLVQEANDIKYMRPDLVTKADKLKQHNKLRAAGSYNREASALQEYVYREKDKVFAARAGTAALGAAGLGIAKAATDKNQILAEVSKSKMTQARMRATDGLQADLYRARKTGNFTAKSDTVNIPFSTNKQRILHTIKLPGGKTLTASKTEIKPGPAMVRK